MSPRQALPAPPGMIPLALGEGFAAYHWAPGPAVLFLPAFGYEALATATVWREVAVRLAASGTAVLRLELPGTGDAGGAPPEAPGQVAAWRAAIDQAIGFLAARHGGAVGLLGCRLGALLALDALGRGARCQRLVLLDPPASGAGYARSLKARARLEGLGPTPEGPDVLQALGVPLTPGTLADIAGLAASLSAPLPPSLVALAPGNALPEPLGPLAAAAELVPFEGYADFVQRDSNQVLPPVALLARIEAFLAPWEPVAALPPPPASGRAISGGREEPVFFHPGQPGAAALFGLLTRPDRPRAGAPAVLLPSLGNLPRSAPQRNWTDLARRLAREGVTSLRFDMPGTADSPGGSGAPPVIDSYHPGRIADLLAATDLLTAQGHPRVVVIGHCSGAYLGFQAAARDARIAGLLAVNPLYLDFLPEAALPGLLRHAPSGAPASPAPAGPKGTGGRVALADRLWQMAKRHAPLPLLDALRRQGTEERATRATLRRILGQGTEVHFVFGTHEEEGWRFRRAFGPRPSLPSGARVTWIEGGEHMLAARRHRALLLDLAVDFILSRSPAGAAPAAIPTTAFEELPA